MEHLEFSDGVLTITMPGGTPYEIAEKRFDSYEKILSWVIHLSEKSWISADNINQISRKMLSIQGLSYPQA